MMRSIFIDAKIRFFRKLTKQMTRMVKINFQVNLVMNEYIEQEMYLDIYQMEIFNILVVWIAKLR